MFNKNGDKTRHTENNLPLSETKKVNIVTNIGGAFYLNRDPAESLAKNSVVSRRGVSFESEALEAPRAKVFRFQIRISIEQLIVPLLTKHMIGCPIRGPVAVPWKCLIFSTAQQASIRSVLKSVLLHVKLKGFCISTPLAKEPKGPLLERAIPPSYYHFKTVEFFVSRTRPRRA